MLLALGWRSSEAASHIKLSLWSIDSYVSIYKLRDDRVSQPCGEHGLSTQDMDKGVTFSGIRAMV
ncbi:Influenza virus NS1A-binding [Gossypium arboreum]|uniref:Influenza virus NS1A-binding n=1 Tax=Gossypium arboreum TaxID=29729 RepID=A0A0B0NNG8_GOSAR|nr:Influenza virus NS1A-binding [Gossypium arboreum]